jgi:hypothetical protein
MDYDGAKAAPTVLAELLGNLRDCDFTVFRIGSRARRRMPANLPIFNDLDP